MFKMVRVSNLDVNTPKKVLISDLTTAQALQNLFESKEIIVR